MPPRSLRWIDLLCDVVLGGVIYHKLGHHVHTIRPEYREKEDVADNWAARFAVNHSAGKLIGFFIPYFVASH